MPGASSEVPASEGDEEAPSSDERARASSGVTESERPRAPEALEDETSMSLDAHPLNGSGASARTSSPPGSPPSSRAPQGPTALEAALVAVAESEPPPPHEAEPARPEPARPEPAATAKANGANGASHAKPADLAVEAPVVEKRDESPAKTETSAKKGKKAKKRAETEKSGEAQSKAATDKPTAKGSASFNFEDELSGVSGSFFNSQPPHEHEHEHEHEILEPRRVISMTPEAIAHRARLRRIVTGVVLVAGALTLIVLAKIFLFGKDDDKRVAPQVTPEVAPEAPVAQAPPAEPTPAEVESPAEGAEPEEAVAAETDEELAADGADDDAEAAAEEDKAEEDKAVEEAAAAAPSADEGKDAEQLRKETLALLNKGKLKDVLEKARTAITADPKNALPYLYLGSAYQDLGKWKEAMGAYNECVRNASTGPVHECTAMGGRK